MGLVLGLLMIMSILSLFSNPDMLDVSGCVVSETSATRRQLQFQELFGAGGASASLFMILYLFVKVFERLDRFCVCV